MKLPIWHLVTDPIITREASCLHEARARDICWQKKNIIIYLYCTPLARHLSRSILYICLFFQIHILILTSPFHCDLLSNASRIRTILPCIIQGLQTKILRCLRYTKGYSISSWSLWAFVVVLGLNVCWKGFERFPFLYRIIDFTYKFTVYTFSYIFLTLATHRYVIS